MFIFYNDASCTSSYYLLGEACVISGQKNKIKVTKSEFAWGMNNFGPDYT